MSRIVYVNGEYVPEGEARVSIFDRGYLLGDGVYEVVPVIGGRMFDKAPFLERLERSLKELSIPWPVDRAAYLAMHEALIARNKLNEGLVYSQVTRGVADRDFAFPKGLEPSLVAFTQEKAILSTPHAEKGVKVATTPDIRWARRDIKAIALLGACISKQEAARKGCYEGWMVEDGHVTEGTSSSAYIVSGGTVITRPLSNAILPGIRRRVLLSSHHGVPIIERPFTVEEAYAADEAFMTSATNLVIPVVEIDSRKVGDGKPGPISKRLRGAYIAAAKAEAGLA